MVMSSFSNGENVHIPKLLKVDPFTNILIDQIHKELLLRMPVKGWHCFIKGMLFKSMLGTRRPMEYTNLIIASSKRQFH